MSKLTKKEFFNLLLKFDVVERITRFASNGNVWNFIIDDRFVVTGSLDKAGWDCKDVKRSRVRRYDSVQEILESGALSGSSFEHLDRIAALEGVLQEMKDMFSLSANFTLTPEEAKQARQVFDKASALLKDKQ